MWNLKQLGYVIDVTKDGRTVLSYTLMKEPPNTKEIRAQFANDCKGVRAGPAKKAPVKKAPAKAPTKKAPVKKAPAKAPTKKKLKVMSVEDVKAAMANKTIPSASSFSVDPDWDALDVSVAELANIL
jgi:ribosomal protein L10